ncbi:Ski oncogene [Orchesella cincta]|uniref:Ski oncogene n=1 Tax=Orchesella cincta TaxID=48709 RepID=A0A1D2MSG7_ORCCI|nr:Ski oncogene [Orchesella cincta]
MLKRNTLAQPYSKPVCDELQIFCSRCSSDQLEVLKVTGVIPMNAHSCGLITKTDAERLVNSLLHRNPPKSLVGSLTGRGKDGRMANCFRIYHECFGKCRGIMMPHLYDKPDALCIECVECHGLFSPIRFVAHSHRRQENRTCHWGFDSANWRHYLLVSRDQDELERWEKALGDFKRKFEHKRKEAVDNGEKDLEDHVVIKKIRYNSPSPMTSPISAASLLESASCLPTKKRLPFIQYSDNDQSTITGFEMDSVKKMVLTRLGPDGGAETVIRLLDKMALRISSLEQICKTQDKTIRNITEAKSGAELQAKVNTMEAELHSLKKQLLRRHGQREGV